MIIIQKGAPSFFSGICPSKRSAVGGAFGAQATEIQPSGFSMLAITRGPASALTKGIVLKCSVGKSAALKQVSKIRMTGMRHINSWRLRAQHPSVNGQRGFLHCFGHGRVRVNRAGEVFGTTAIFHE